jgi:hypothetical protein
MQENSKAVPLLSDSGSIRPRSLMIALLLGALPALVVWFGEEQTLQRWDLAVAAAVLLCALLLLRRHSFPRLEHVPWAVVALIAMLPVGLAAFHLSSPVTNDENSVLLQATILAEGRLSEPLAVLPTSSAIPPAAAISFAAAFHRPQVFDDFEKGTRFSKYAPGTAFALTPATLLGQPWLATLGAALFDLWLIFLVARALGLATPKVAPLLLVTSPFFLLVHTSVQSEVFTAPAVLAGYLAFLKTRAGRPQWALALGLACGWIFLTRPLTGVLFAFLAGVLLLWQRDRLKTIPLAIAGGLPMLALTLWWNHHFTGQWFTSVYEIYATTFGPFTAPPELHPIDVYGNGDFFAGLLRQCGRWSVAFGGMLGAISLGVWGAWRLRARDGGLSFLFALLLPCAYAFHWYPGHRAYLGPLYLFETLALLLCAALFLLEQAPAQWRHSFLLAMVSLGGVAFAARWQLIAEESQLRSNPQRMVAEQLSQHANAVVFLPKKYMGSKEKALKYWTPSRPLDLAAGGPVILRTTNELTPARLVQGLGLEGRQLYRFIPNQDGLATGILEPFALTESPR